MTGFHEIRFPDKIAYGATGGPEFATTVVVTGAGHEQRNVNWAEARGRNAFYEISVPDAALKLIQACGRLIRHEGDYGHITMLDKRIVTQRYGRALLESLPPYRLDLAS